MKLGGCIGLYYFFLLNSSETNFLQRVAKYIFENKILFLHLNSSNYKKKDQTIQYEICEN